MATLTLNWGGPGYSSYEVLAKKSKQETHTFGSLQVLSQQMQDAYTTQFRHMQGLLNNVIVPQLTQMLQNPQGFGSQGLAAMRSSLQNTLGAQYLSQVRGLQNQFATENTAGLGSGVEMALQTNMAQNVSGEFASGLENINIQDAMLKNQQQQFAAQGLMQADQLYGQLPQSAGMMLQSLGTQFNMANVLNQQGTFWSNLAIGAATALGGPLAGQSAAGEFGGGGIQGNTGMIPVGGSGGTSGTQGASSGGAWLPTMLQNIGDIGAGSFSFGG